MNPQQRPQRPAAPSRRMVPPVPIHEPQPVNPETAQPYYEGELVRLKSGGPTMVVTYVRWIADHGLWVVKADWFAKDDLNYTHTWDVICLEPAPPATPPESPAPKG